MLKRLLTAFGYLVLVTAALSVAGWAWLRATDATAADFKDFQRGDIIFQTSHSSQSLAILLASNSPFSHMGIVDTDANGRAIVLEASATTRATLLEDWIKRGVGLRIAVYRLANLSESMAQSLSDEARKHFGKRYDIHFFSNSAELYCSEFVSLVFKNGVGIDLGRYQAISALDLDNYAARKVIERRWKTYPLCTDDKVTDFNACFAIIQDQLIITPKSIATDAKLNLVYSNYGPLGE